MTERFETEIRQALDARAYEVEVPSELAAQTMDRVAAIEVRQPLLQRLKTRRDAKHMRYPADGRPRWLIGAGAVAGAAALLLIGTFVTMPSDRKVLTQTAVEKLSGDDRSPAVRRERAESGDAVAGQVAGVVSSGDGSVDAWNRSEDVDIVTGDASGSNSTDQFVGLTPGSSTLVADDLNGGPASGQVARESGSGGAAPQLVQSAEIRVAVARFDDAWNDAHDLVADHQGDVVNLRTSLKQGIAEGTLRIRVPSDELDPLIVDLRRLGTLASLRTTGDDIAEQIDATKTKLADQKERRTEAERLAQTGTFSQREAARQDAEALKKDIERLEKKQDGLEEQVEFSFVSATLYQDETAARRGSSMIGTAARTSGRLALTVLAGALVAAGVLAPLALIAVAIWLVTRTLRRRRGT